MPPESSVHEFGPFRLDTAERLLLRAGQPVPLTPKAFDLLIYLVERHGRLITKKELLSAVWPDTFVEEANLTYTVSALRRALGDSQDGERYIQTVPTRGYRFLAPVAAGGLPPIRQVAEAHDAAHVSHWWKEIALLSGALGAILLALLVGLATVHFRERRPDQSRVVFTLPRDPAAFPQYNLPAISPDGTRVVFYGPGDGGKLVLWSRALDSLAVQPLAGTDLSNGAPYPFWSPDGHFIAFFAGGKLKKIAADGGASQEIAPAPEAAGGSWGSDGTIIFSPQAGPLYRVSAAGGPATPLRELDASRGELRHVWPHFLPDGKHYLYVARSSDAEKTGIYLRHRRHTGLTTAHTWRVERCFISAGLFDLSFATEPWLLKRSRSAPHSSRTERSPSPVMVAGAFQRRRRSDCFPFRRMAFWRMRMPIWSMSSRLVRPAREGAGSDGQARRIRHRRVCGRTTSVRPWSVLVRKPDCGCFGCRNRGPGETHVRRRNQSRLVTRRTRARVRRPVGQLP